MADLPFNHPDARAKRAAKIAAECDALMAREAEREMKADIAAKIAIAHRQKGQTDADA